MYYTVGYARVSSKEQANDTNALDQQCTRLQQYGCTKVFVDVESGYRGKKRKALSELMELVRTNRVNCVVITRVDRISRNTREAFTLVEEFLKHNVGLKVLDEPIDLTTSAGKMAAGMLIVMAQHHSDQKSESVRHGWNHHRATKKANVPLFGYLKVNDKYVLDSSTFLCTISDRREYSKADIARDIISIFTDTKSLRACLRELNNKYGYQRFTQSSNFEKNYWLNSPHGLSKWLRNPVLQGHTLYRTREGNQLIENTHADQTILSPLEYSYIESLLAKNHETKGYGAGKQKFPLSGLLYCAVCRNSFYARNIYKSRKHEGEKTIYYQCRHYLIKSCTNSKTIRADVTEEIVFKRLTEYASTITDKLIDKVADTKKINPKIVELQKQLDALEKIPGDNIAIARAIDNIKAQIFEINSQESEQKLDNNLITQSFIDIFSSPPLFKIITYNERRELLLMFVDKIIINDGEVVDIILKI